MKIKDGFILKKFAGKYIAVSSDDLSDEKNILITLNSTGAFVWQFLQQNRTYSNIVNAITAEYEVDAETAKNDLDEFLQIVRKRNLLDE